MTLPWQVRYQRWWYFREAQRHRDCIGGARLLDGTRVCRHAGIDDREPCPYNIWHAELAIEYEFVARSRRAWWVRTGSIPLVVCDEITAKARMAGIQPYFEPTTLEHGRYVWSRPSWWML